ncbi:hypothetical protein [Microscilla marina]|uniref:Outer membrane protein beta-barrel domain-containing protein n=1 Tax=Microscilla marina ATCC 23134 TaxID=313606 RepID=A1ZW28_MICM2|nr:hypothetical protein [Microscilla marina]EAY25391.1 hypothetical protein M23134_06650 [Microscilla marina ATCC 23134]
MMRYKTYLLYNKVLTLLCLVCLSATVSAQYVPKDKRKKTPAKDSVTTKKETPPQKSEKKQNPKKDNDIGRRWVFGGNFWVQFGNVTFIDIAPTIGYKLTRNLIAGVGIGYVYARSRLATNLGNLDVENQIYSGRTFLQYIINTEALFGEGNRLFLYSEYEVLRSDYYDRVLDRQNSIWVRRPQIGGGIQQKLGNLYVNLLVLYNLNYLEDITPYPNPITIRLGFNVGL